MLHQISVIFLVEVALILSVNAAHLDPSTNCVKFGGTCDQHHRCCGENLKCDQSNIFGRYKCKEKAKLGNSCRETFHCIDIVHSVCSKNECVCRQNNVKVSDYACAPVLNGYCWKNETCATENSLCIDNECKCKDGFVAEGNECLPAVIGSKCSDDAACASVKFAECSRRKVCACSHNTIAISSRLCSMALGGTCYSDRDCGVAHSWCDNNKCKCKDQYVAYSNTECRLPYFGMSCKHSDNCNAHFIDSVCIDNICTCKDNYKQEEKACLPIKQCEEEEECQEMNGVCIAGSCQCSNDSVMKNSKCLPKQLKGRCSEDSDCSEIKFAVCLKNKCACPNEFFTVNATTCGKSLGGSCTVNEDCAVELSHCFGRKCQCNRGYMPYSKSQCIATDLGKPCFHDRDCNLIKNAHCFESQCSCNDNYIEMDAFTCAPLLNATCSNDLGCAPENSVCFDHKCKCEIGYLPKSNTECVLIYLEQRCRFDWDCVDIPYAKCSDAGKCICHENYVRTGPKTCSATLGASCKSDKECATINAECSKNRCRCSTGYIQRFDDLCYPVFLGQKCDSEEDCDKISNAECFKGKCQCRQGYTKFDRDVCLPLIGAKCTDHKECAVYNSNCVDNICQCLEDFIPQTESQCVAASTDAICYSDNDCYEINTHCSRFNLCTCNRNFISINNTCVKILGATCYDSASCTTPNSECIDNKCQCSPNYVQGHHQECLLNLLGRSCQTDYDCQSIPNAICSDRICVCKPDTFALTPSTCTNLLGTGCSTSADCGIEASHCFENKCQCKPDWAALTDMMCVRRSAVYDCDSNIECGEPWRSRCDQNYCVCNANHTAIDALTCLPVLGGNCWRDDQCMTQNSHCNDFRCQCKPGYASVARNMCVAS